MEQGFAGDEEKDQWKGEDEELDLAVRGREGIEASSLKGLSHPPPLPRA